MDVLIDMTTFDTPSRHRGIGRYVRGLCDALVGIRGESTLELAGLVGLHGGDNIDPTLTYAGKPEATLTALAYQRHKLERRLLMGRAARRSGARLLHLPDPPGTPFDMRTPRVVSCMDLIPLVLHQQYGRFPGEGYLQWVRALVRYRTALHVISISEYTKRDLVEHVGVPAERVTVVPLAVDHDTFTAGPVAADERERVAACVGTEGDYALYVGAADPRKNVPLMIRAYAKSGIDIPLALAGPISDGKRAEIERLAEREGVGASVRVLGYVDEDLVVPLYRHCLMHVFPSSYEGFGLPVIEAMACGAPTICAEASSLAEVAGDAALTMELSLESLADAMQRLAGDEELRSQLRARGLERARGFTWERCARATLRVYEEVLS